MFHTISPAASSMPLWHKLLLPAPKGASICHSYNVCIPRWILICSLFRCVGKASSWPLCLSGLNCLITVIIWTGSKISWHPDIMLALLGGKKKRKKKTEKVLWKPEWMMRGSPEDEWRCLVCDPQGCDVFTHKHKTARMHTVFPLACIWIPHVSRTFRCYQMKKLDVRASVPSEEGPGAVWLIHDSPGALRPGSPRSSL